MTKEQIIIKKTCRSCNELHQLHIYKEDYKVWENGKLIQQAMPYLPSSMRELLISGICGTCFDGLFKGL